MIKTHERFLSACSYIFFVTALYIILSDKRKIEYDAYNAAQAMLLWLGYLAVFIVLRIIYAFLSGVHYFLVYDLMIKLVHLSMFAYAIYLAYLTYNEKEFKIPYVSDIAEKLI